MGSNLPPRLPSRFLRWFCKRELVDEIEGDLLEAYQQRLLASPAKAKRKFWKEVIQSFKLGNIGIMEKYQDRNIVRQIAMVKQYTKILFRTARKYKIYSSISIASLTLGITCAGLIFLYLQKELNFDRTYEKASSIYRINHKSERSGRTYAFAPTAMTPHLIENLDAVTTGTRIFKYRRAIPMTVVSTRQSFNEPRFGWVDPEFFDLFDLKLLRGNRNTILQRPNTVVLSESTVKRYFGDMNPIGQTILFSWEEETPLEVVGVYEDFKSNTSFQLDLMSNLITCRDTMWSGGWFRDWRNMFVSAYIEIRPGTEELVTQTAQEATSQNYTPDNPDAWTVSLQQLTDIHLAEPKDIGEWSQHNDQETLTLFGAIGLIILCLGCFNFTNMVTAQAGQRTKEVGVRKVLGSDRRQIAQQTFFETLVFVFLSAFFSLVLMWLMMPILGTLTQHIYGVQDFMSTEFVIAFLSALGLVIVAAGSYPAFYISRIQSLQLMKKGGAGGNKVVRNVLVAAQFTISSGLVICTMIVYLQLRYLQNKEIGFDQSVIVNMPIHNDEAVIPKIDAFRTEVTSSPGVTHVTAASHEMFSDYTYLTFFQMQGHDEPYRWERYTVEHDYISTFDLELIAGRGFDRSIQSDSTAFVLNESAVRAMGTTPEEVIGKNMTDNNLEKTGKIVGVVKDFHFRSLHHTIQPFVMYVNKDRLDYVSARIASTNLSDNIDQLERAWYSVFGEQVPFFADLLDQQTADLYEAEQNERKLFTSFSVVSVVLGCLGLFGSALFTTERRFKEIGLRKVLGADSWQVILMINRNFMKIIAVAFVIATPAAYLLMKDWLDAFAYRIQQPWWVYVTTAVATVLIAAVTVSYLSWKAASSNPVEAIKVE